MTRKILMASGNAHKIAEIAPILEQAGFTVTDARAHALPEPVEDGETFIDNARIKARAAMEATGMAVLADDSGLIIDALGEFPGVNTSPYVKECGGFQNAVDDLFQRLNGKEAKCHYVSILVLLFPDGQEIIAKGRINGILLPKPTTTEEGRFGFDPWFKIEGLEQTFGDLTTEDKNKMSHRSKALQDLLKQLQLKA